MSETLSDERLKDLYTDPTYRASFAGSNTFFNAIKSDFKAKNKYAKVVKLLTSIPTYIYHTRQYRLHDSRHLKYIPDETGSNFIPGNNISFQGDLAEMPESNGYRYFLLLIDLFDNYLYTVPLPNKTADVVGKAIVGVKNKFDLTMSALSTDLGLEFQGSKTYLQKHDISLFYMRGKHKAFLVRGFFPPHLTYLYFYIADFF